MSVPAAVTQLSFMMVYGVVEVYVAIYAVLHCLPSEGIYFIGIAVAGTCGGKSGEARLVYTGNAAIITRILLLVFAHNIPCYLLLWQHCWDTVSELCSLPCRPWPCLSKDEVPQALRFSWLSISGLHWEDCIGIVSFYSIILLVRASTTFVFLQKTKKKRIRHEPDNA